MFFLSVSNDGYGSLGNIEMRISIEGWAYKPNEELLVARARQRSHELHASTQPFKVEDREFGYGHTIYQGTAGAELSAYDIALLCDPNLCFGASVEREGERFTCRVSID